MPSFVRPVARWWYPLAPEPDSPPGPALSPSLLAEEREHGLTEDVAWAYAEAMPRFLAADVMARAFPLACWRGSMRAAVVLEPLRLEGLLHVQTDNPEVCKVLGASVPSWAIEGEACLEALEQHGSAVKTVTVTRALPREVRASFRVDFGVPSSLFHIPLAEQFLPVVQLDTSVWLSWDRDLAQPCVVKDHDRLIEGRFGPRDVAPEAHPPPWCSGDARWAGPGWAATVLELGGTWHPRSTLLDPARGWGRISLEGTDWGALGPLGEAWRGDQPLGAATKLTHGTLVSLQLRQTSARCSWVGLERVTRLRAGALQTLTRDHDLEDGLARGALEPLPEGVVVPPNLCTRALPSHEPEHLEVDLQPGDRFLLASTRATRALEEAAGGPLGLAARVGEGSVVEVARWAKHALLGVDGLEVVLVVDADARLEQRATPLPVLPPAPPTVRDLVERPEAFHGTRIRTRGVFRASVEVRDFAAAWFEGEAPFELGTGIVEAEGLWVHEAGRGYGHFNQWASALRGTMRLVDLSASRWVNPERLQFARPYVALRTELLVERGLREWEWQGRRVMRLGRDGRLPLPEVPDRGRIRARLCRSAMGGLGLLDFEVLETFARQPEPATLPALGRVGRYVEVEGLLRPTDRFPRLDEQLDVTPPSLLKTFVLPNAAQVAHLRSVLGTGRRVVIRGEVADMRLLATSIEGDDGPLAL